MGEAPTTIPTRSRRFAALLATLFLGAFNDNAYKFAVQLLLIGSAAKYLDRVGYVAKAMVAFAVPFVLFSGLAGYVADRFPKHHVVRGAKAAELVIMAMAWYFFHLDLPALLFLGLFLMGTQSAFFAPAKYGILPEVLLPTELSKGNGFLAAATFAAVILGVAGGGAVSEAMGQDFSKGGALFVVIAVIGLLVSFFVPVTRAANPNASVRLNPFRTWKQDVAEVKQHPQLPLAIIGIAYFYFIGVPYQLNLVLYGKEVLGMGDNAVALLSALAAVGIAVGSVAAGYLSRGRVETGLVPVGALLMGLCSLALGLVRESPQAAYLWIGLLGVSMGLFIVPLNATLQQRSPGAVKGQMIAFSNMLSSVAMVGGTFALWGYALLFEASPAHLFWALGVASLVACVLFANALFVPLLVFVFGLLLNTVYRMRVIGLENLPKKGGALLVANHVSWIDAFVLGVALPTLPRFLLFRSFYEQPLLNRLFRKLGVLPITGTDSPKATLTSLLESKKSVENGQWVLIFPEGWLTRTGQTGRFKGGCERIVRDTVVPVVPIHLDGLWGSLFSYSGGRFLFKWPTSFRRQVTVSIGTPLSPHASAHQMRDAVQLLASQVAGTRKAEMEILPYRFLRTARRHPFQMLSADSTGRQVSRVAALTGTILLSRVLTQRLSPAKPVAVHLPTCVGAQLANLALAFAGRTAVNVNFMAPPDDLADCMARAGATDVITSRVFTAKRPAPDGLQPLYLEELFAGPSSFVRASVYLACLLLPSRLLGALTIRADRKAVDELVTILFSSGSTGKPKGVVLSHFNLLSNIDGAAALFQFGKGDRIAAVLPFFHSFGYTITCWLPAVTGVSVAYHPNPLEGRLIGDLVEQSRCSVLLATPTFLSAYMRQVKPNQFRSLRMVVAGAERLNRQVADRFMERFGVQVFEGYGATECSPAISFNVPDQKLKGATQFGNRPGSVGQPLPNTVVRVVDPESFDLREPGEDGMLLVRGPGVMTGYLKDDAATRDAIRDGWYVTGDIGSLDRDGFITITDRLARFSKIGGEMVSHGRIEGAILSACGCEPSDLAIISVSDPTRGERLVVFHLEGVLQADSVIAKLKEDKLPNLWIPRRNDFCAIDHIPLLGSGKIDYPTVKGFYNIAE